MTDKRWLVRGGALLVLLGFVLPSMTVSCSGLTDIGRPLSLSQVASLANMPLLYLVPLGALAVMILAFLPTSLNAPPAALFWGQVAGAAVGLIYILIAFISMNNQIQMYGFQINPQIGMFSLIAGYILVGIGLVLQWPELNKAPPRITPVCVSYSDQPPEYDFKNQAPLETVKEPAGSYLLLLSGNLPKIITPIDSEFFLIGRDLNCDLYLEDRTVSRQHARLRYAAGAWYIQDQDSTAGIYVNDLKVPAKRLSSGDQITIGEYTFEFHAE
jgi:hypothetical protein